MTAPAHSTHVGTRAEHGFKFYCSRCSCGWEGLLRTGRGDAVNDGFNHLTRPASPEAAPCACWSCNSECGGTDDPGSCGPVAANPAGVICLACSEKADVFDDNRTGAQAVIAQDRVHLTVDVFDTYRAAHIWLNPASARLLAVKLLTLAADLEADRQ